VTVTDATGTPAGRAPLARRVSAVAVILAVAGLAAVAGGVLALGPDERGGVVLLVIGVALLAHAGLIGRARWRAAADPGRWPVISVGRKIANAWYVAGCVLALILVIGPAVWLIGGVLANALPHWQWSVITTNTNGETGGLKQAILGTLLITLGVLIIGGTISVLAGLYLAEFATGRLGAVLRTGYAVLSGVPSVVLGLVAYLVLVSTTGAGWKYGLAPAVIVVSVIVVPYITRATETSLRHVPAAYREGAEALGLSPARTLFTIVLKAALPGIVTGLLVAIAISVGETAPLLYTAGWSDFNPSLQLTGSPIGFLTYPVFAFYNLPDPAAKILSYDAALLLLVFLLVIIVVGRVVVGWSRRHAE
jgi:phosphate transport system permease protein